MYHIRVPGFAHNNLLENAQAEQTNQGQTNTDPKKYIQPTQ